MALLSEAAAPIWGITSEPVLIVADFQMHKARTSKLFIPRGDTDNFEKGLYDIITQDGRFWHDDNQIITNISTKRYIPLDEPEGVAIGIIPTKPHEFQTTNISRILGRALLCITGED